MLEGVTLGEVVQFVVEVLIDLASSTVLDKETAEHSETTHPEHLAISSHQQTISKLFPRCIPIAMISFCYRGGLHTWAYEHPWYPSSYQNPGGDRFVGQRSAPGRGHASAW